MNLSKLTRIAGLALIVALSALPMVSANPPQPCSCDYCQTVAPTTRCLFNGSTTCGAWLSVTLCPAQ
ncbi:MAG TPA: hypothetical protein VF414_11125 [Thermoanaerobaculia bacterium]